jgi:ATP-dependent protease ClpP protease subunit
MRVAKNQEGYEMEIVVNRKFVQTMRRDRTVSISGILDERLYDAAMSRLDALYKGAPKKPIWVELDSIGGSVALANQLNRRITEIRADGAHVYAFVRNQCEGAAILIFLACEVRMCTSTARFRMYAPQPYEGIMGKYYGRAEISKALGQTPADIERHIALLAGALGVSIDEVQALYREGEHPASGFTPDMALERKIATTVVSAVDTLLLIAA